KDSADDFDPRPHRLLIEALSRSPESAQFAIHALNDPAITDFREVFAVDLLGHLRHRPAMELIVEKLLSKKERDFLLESCTDALIRIGGTQIVQALVQRWKKMSWGIKLYACDVLNGAKLKEAETALIEIFDQESDQSLRTKIALALCDTA